MRGSVGFQTFHLYSVLPPSTVSALYQLRVAVAALPPRVKLHSRVPLQLNTPPIYTSSTIPISVRNLDRIRIFRRRQDSPSRSPDDREPRERSPSWFQRMHRNMSSSKRSRSSSTQPETPAEVDCPEHVTLPVAARDHISDGPPKMPLFLQQSPSGRSSETFKYSFLVLIVIFTDDTGRYTSKISRAYLD